MGKELVADVVLCELRAHGFARGFQLALELCHRGQPLDGYAISFLMRQGICELRGEERVRKAALLYAIFKRGAEHDGLDQVIGEMLRVLHVSCDARLAHELYREAHRPLWQPFDLARGIAAFARRACGPEFEAYNGALLHLEAQQRALGERLRAILAGPTTPEQARRPPLPPLATRGHLDRPQNVKAEPKTL